MGLAPVALFIGLACRLTAAAPAPVPDYRVGETATVDIISPLRLIVIDHERTDKLRQEEAQRAAPIFRFYPDAITEAEAGLRAAFSASHGKFLDALEANYARRTLNEVAITYPRFRRLVTSFQRQSRTFPVSTNLARLWALGASDESIQSNLVAELRETMERPIRAEAMPAEAKLGPRQIMMIAVRPKTAALDLALVEKLATNVLRTNIYTLARARAELQADFPLGEQAMGVFVAGFVKENCAFDPELTRQSREKRTEAIWAADEYEPGQLIVKRGDVITLRIKAVLDQLRQRAAGEQAKRDVVKGKLETQTAVAQLQQQAVRAETNAELAAEENRWLLGGIIGSLLAFLLVLWRLRRWKRSHSLLPARVRNDEIAGTVISCPCCSGTIVLPLELAGSASSLPAPATPPSLPAGVAVPAEAGGHYWRDRALAAENRMQKTNQVLRTSLMPHLARWLMSKLVRGLALERTHLLVAHRAAEQGLAELEQRLNSVQAPLEERLKAYEQRIADLEKALAAKGEENREIIKATIAVTQKKLAEERSKDRLAWN